MEETEAGTEEEKGKIVLFLYQVCFYLWYRYYQNKNVLQ